MLEKMFNRNCFIELLVLPEIIAWCANSKFAESVTENGCQICRSSILRQKNQWLVTGKYAAGGANGRWEPKLSSAVTGASSSDHWAGGCTDGTGGRVWELWSGITVATGGMRPAGDANAGAASVATLPSDVSQYELLSNCPVSGALAVCITNNSITQRDKKQTLQTVQ